MPRWPRTLSSSYRSSLSSVAPTRLPQSRHVSLVTFPRPSPYSRLSFRRPVVWLLPVVGGIAVYFYPSPRSVLSHLFSSSTLIPCPSHEPPICDSPLILSPSEHHLSLFERIRSLFVDHIWEPILTARRFIHLFFLFAPVILSSPMLLLGSPEERLQGDRWGAVWWYDYLVAQLDRAGPTFIKVRNIVPLFGNRLTPRSMVACSMGGLARRFVSRFVV
jgi:aarF domain-containing kinase